MNLKVISTGSKGNAYILGNENESLLIECGVTIKELKKAFDFDFSKLAGCILTHEHGDHAKGLNDLTKCGVNVYGSAGTFEALQPKNPHRIKKLTILKAQKIGNFKVMAFDVKHDAAEPVGYLIEHPDCGRVLFLTDTYYCEYTFPKLNNIIIEANFCEDIISEKYGKNSNKEFLKDRILKSHFSLQNCKDLLLANDLSAVNRIVLIHLSDTNSNELQFQKTIKDATGLSVIVAAAGININLDKTPF